MQRGIRGGRIVDVGCGVGNLYPLISPLFDEYVGVDAIRYDGLPAGVQFVPFELNSGILPLPAASFDVVMAVETIEHLENPREFMRQLVGLVRPGGWVIVTTPNQLSFLSLLTLVMKQRFSAFQDVHYPAHLTALLEIDLLRIGTECGLIDCGIEYSLFGRVCRPYLLALPRISCELSTATLFGQFASDRQKGVEL